MTTDSDSTSSPQLSVTLKFAEYINTKDLQRIKTLVTDDFVYQALPLSLNRPPRTADEMIAAYNQYFSAVPDFKVHIREIVESPGKVWAYGYSTGQSLILNEPYNNTYVLMFDIVESPTGAKISHLKEFMDSAFVEGFRKRLLDTLQTSKKP